ncbi:hypothetical protein NDU88_007016 [Pleurodeles waltl]|uniref:Uncharacterized protein n=1 Tax=Pleurodeles waltl TaxID=8319 RepID=A0AAV7NTM6_PLEWA|nr:hypothetical protein NDU88_007016 [Pleurodeles waltl]
MPSSLLPPMKGSFFPAFLCETPLAGRNPVGSRAAGPASSDTPPFGSRAPEGDDRRPPALSAIGAEGAPSPPPAPALIVHGGCLAPKGRGRLKLPPTTRPVDAAELTPLPLPPPALLTCGASRRRFPRGGEHSATAATTPLAAQDDPGGRRVPPTSRGAHLVQQLHGLYHPPVHAPSFHDPAKGCDTNGETD